LPNTAIFLIRSTTNYYALFVSQLIVFVNVVQAVGSFPASTRIFPSSGNLTVVNLSPEDHGVYECVAASVVSSVITTTLLIIERM